MQKTCSQYCVIVDKNIIYCGIFRSYFLKSNKNAININSFT